MPAATVLPCDSGSSNDPRKLLADAICEHDAAAMRMNMAGRRLREAWAVMTRQHELEREAAKLAAAVLVDDLK